MFLSALAKWSAIVSAVCSPIACLAQNVPLLPLATMDNITVSFDMNQNRRNSQPLNPQLISLSIEFCYATDFVGIPGAPIEIFGNLLQNIQDISGVRPVLRIGGNTQDLAKFCEDCPQALNNTFTAGKTEAVNVTYSKDLFRAMDQNFGADQQYIFGLNLGQDEFSIARSALDGALKYINQSKILAYELGNEPDRYLLNQTGPFARDPKTWSIDQYAIQTYEWLQQLTDGDRFQYGSIAMNPISSGNFTMVEAVKLGTPRLISEVKILSSHAYMGAVCIPSLAALVQLPNYLNHINTVSYFAAFDGEIAAAKSINAVYHMGETNSAACHGKDGVSNTMGAALWMIDYSLLMATKGTDRLFFHNGKGDFYYSVWEPAINSSIPAKVNPQYYSMLFIADVVSGLEAPHVSRVPSLDSFDSAFYAIYDGDCLAKLVILDMRFYNQTSVLRTPRTFNVSSLLGENIVSKRLTAPSSDAKEGVEWATRSVDQTGKLIGTEDTETSTNGQISMLQSEAVIIERA